MVTVTFVPSVFVFILDKLDVVVKCPDVSSLPLLTVNVTSEVYQSLLPFVPFIAIVPTVIRLLLS